MTPEIQAADQTRISRPFPSLRVSESRFVLAPVRLERIIKNFIGQTAIPAWAQEEIEREQRNGKEVRVTKEMAQRLGLSI